MGRKCIEVESLYELTIDDLNELKNRSDSNYTRDLISTVIMRYNGVHPQVIADTLSKCRATVVSYLRNWNEMGIACITDNRGDNIVSAFTDEMMEDVRDVVMHKSPRDVDYDCSRWSCALISRYIEETYGLKYSESWVRLLFNNLGFTYKRGVYKPTLANPELQESFKKNVRTTGYN
jgi:transposase